MKDKNKIYHLLLAIGLGGLIAGFVMCHFLMYYQVIRFQQNVVGVLVQGGADVVLPEETEYASDVILQEETEYDFDGFLHTETQHAITYAYALFEPFTEENVEVGKAALLQYGFTEKGWSYIAKAMGLFQSIIWMCIGVLPLFLLVIIVFYKKECLYRLEKQELEKKILILKQSQMEEEYLLKQQKRMQSFIENIAHQIKTPISRVFTSLDIIEADLEEGIARLRIEECYSHLESVNVLLKRLIDIGRLEAGKVIFRKDLLLLNELLEDIIESFGKDTDRIVFSCESKMQNTLFYGDGEWLKEAFLNIIKNALEADESEMSIEVHCSRTDDFFKIFIRDHGKGLRECDIPNIFDRFYLPEDVKTNHTGIGLNLAKLIIEGHRGSVYVYNHTEGGAVFQVIFPVYESLKVTSG